MDDKEFETLKLRSNERAKLIATTYNTVGVAILGGGFILPLIGMGYEIESAPKNTQVNTMIAIGWAGGAVWLHYLARKALEELRA